MREWRETRYRTRHARQTHPSRRPQNRGQDPRVPQSGRLPKGGHLIAEWGKLEWRRRWEAALRKRRHWPTATIWSTPWKQDTRMLYAGLSKAESTALFLMRSEIIGLNAWLASIQVPDINPACPCGWHAQNVRHILLHCPRYARTDLLLNCGSERLSEILSQPACAKHAARWLIQSGAMEQFRVAKEVAEEALEGYEAFQEAEEW